MLVRVSSVRMRLRTRVRTKYIFWPLYVSTDWDFCVYASILGTEKRSDDTTKDLEVCQESGELRCVVEYQAIQIAVH